MPEEIIAFENAMDEKANCCCRTKVRSEKEQKDLCNRLSRYKDQGRRMGDR